MLLSLLLALAAAAPPQAVDASRITVTAPKAIVELDISKLGGDPVRLAWSPDGNEMYLQVVQKDRFGNAKVKHFLLSQDGSAPRGTDLEPAWASKYWSWKSFPSAPANADFKIALDTQQGVAKATSTPRGGAMARGGAEGDSGRGTAGTSPEDAIAAAQQSQKIITQTMRLKGEVLGEWVNAPVTPGSTFGWAPAPLALIAYTDRGGRVVLMDPEGKKNPLADTKDALLPAWSQDAKKLAFLQRKDKKKFVLTVADVTVPSATSE